RACGIRRVLDEGEVLVREAVARTALAVVLPVALAPGVGVAALEDAGEHSVALGAVEELLARQVAEAGGDARRGGQVHRHLDVPVVGRDGHDLGALPGLVRRWGAHVHRPRVGLLPPLALGGGARTGARTGARAERGRLRALPLVLGQCGHRPEHAADDEHERGGRADQRPPLAAAASSGLALGHLAGQPGPGRGALLALPVGCHCSSCGGTGAGAAGTVRTPRTRAGRAGPWAPAYRPARAAARPG